MANKTLTTRISCKHDTEANWTKAVNFTPLAGELIIYDADEINTLVRFKIGDGSTKVNALPFFESGPNWEWANGDYKVQIASTAESIYLSKDNVICTNLGTGSLIMRDPDNSFNTSMFLLTYAIDEESVDKVPCLTIGKNGQILGSDNGLRITNLLAPTADTEAVNKKYVDDLLGDVAATNIYVAGENPPDNAKLLWIDTEDEDTTVLETVATTGSFNDLKDVPSWLKSSTKPTYTAAEVGAATEAYVQQAITDAISLYDGEYFEATI